MATVYYEFDSTVANLVTDLKTYILTSTDWANITGNILKATTARGAQMVVDLTDAAIAVDHMQLAFYRTHDGTTGVDKVTRYLYWRDSSGGTTANPLHVTVSAGKDFLFVAIDGPRGGESGAYNGTWGSSKNYFFLCDLVPYFAGDTVPTVVAGAATTASASCSISNLSHIAYVARNQGNTTSWVPARLATLDFPSTTGSETFNVTRDAVGDGKYYVSPYVVFEDADGIRGRLSDIFFAGHTQISISGEQIAQVGRKVTYNGKTYKVIQANRTNTGGNQTWGCLGSANNAGTANMSVAVAIPTA